MGHNNFLIKFFFLFPFPYFWTEIHNDTSYDVAVAALKMPVVVSTHISDNVNDNNQISDLNHHNQDIPTTICAFENSVISKVPVFKSVIESTNQLKNSCEVNATVEDDTPDNNNDENETGEVRNLLLLTTRNSGEVPMVESELRKSQSDDVVAISRELIYNNPSVITSGLTQSRLLQNNNNNNNRYDNNYASSAIMVNPNANRFGNYTIHFPNGSSGIHQAFTSAYSWAHDLSIKSDIVTKEEMEKVQNNNNNNNNNEIPEYTKVFIENPFKNRKLILKVAKNQKGVYV